MQSVLILEDDLDLAKSLESIFRQQGLLVSRVGSLAAAKEVLKTEFYALAVIDRVLPDGDGLELVEELTATNFQTKTLVLTSRNKTLERTRGLSLGADDYLGKPFTTRELWLRAANLLSKYKIMLPEVVTGRDISLYLKSGVVVIGDHQTRLRPKEAAILACLIRHQGMVVTQQVLADFIWGDTINQPLPKTLGVYIRRIRMTLGKFSDRVETLRNFGYRLR